jgi:hypothetical protein
MVIHGEQGVQRSHYRWRWHLQQPHRSDLLLAVESEWSSVVASLAMPHRENKYPGTPVPHICILSTVSTALKVVCRRDIAAFHGCPELRAFGLLKLDRGQFSVGRGKNSSVEFCHDPSCYSRTALDCVRHRGNFGSRNLSQISAVKRL